MNHKLFLLIILWGGIASMAQGQTQKPPTPCEDNPVCGQFDFWVGEWEVHGPKGQKAGENSIVKKHQGCLIEENWTGRSGAQGTSINYYDPRDGKWVQTWVGLNILIDIRGGIKDGSMVLEGQIHYYGKDVTNPFRGTWTLLPDGRVRQFFEESKDGGKTWGTWFEGFYTRKK